MQTTSTLELNIRPQNKIYLDTLYMKKPRQTETFDIHA